jgi:hypothetical protein
MDGRYKDNRQHYQFLIDESTKVAKVIKEATGSIYVWDEKMVRVYSRKYDELLDDIKHIE